MLGCAISFQSLRFISELKPQRCFPPFPNLWACMFIIEHQEVAKATQINENDRKNAYHAILNPTPAVKPGSMLADLWNVTDAWPLQSGTTPKQTWIPHITNFTLQGLHSKEFCLFFLPGHDKKAQWSKGMGRAIPCQEFEGGALCCQQAKDFQVEEFSALSR